MSSIGQQANIILNVETNNNNINISFIQSPLSFNTDNCTLTQEELARDVVWDESPPENPFDHYDFESRCRGVRRIFCCTLYIMYQQYGRLEHIAVDPPGGPSQEVGPMMSCRYIMLLCINIDRTFLLFRFKSESPTRSINSSRGSDAFDALMSSLDEGSEASPVPGLRPSPSVVRRTTPSPSRTDIFAQNSPHRAQLGEEGGGADVVLNECQDFDTLMAQAGVRPPDRPPEAHRAAGIPPRPAPPTPQGDSLPPQPYGGPPDYPPRHRPLPGPGTHIVQQCPPRPGRGRGGVSGGRQGLRSSPPSLMGTGVAHRPPPGDPPRPALPSSHASGWTGGDMASSHEPALPPRPTLPPPSGEHPSKAPRLDGAVGGGRGVAAGQRVGHTGQASPAAPAPARPPGAEMLPAVPTGENALDELAEFDMLVAMASQAVAARKGESASSTPASLRGESNAEGEMEGLTVDDYDELLRVASQAIAAKSEQSAAVPEAGASSHASAHAPVESVSLDDYDAMMRMEAAALASRVRTQSANAIRDSRPSPGHQSIY